MKYERITNSEQTYYEYDGSPADIYNHLVELEDKIENASRVEIHYKPPFQTKYAVVEYFARQGKPLKIASYDIYGEELKSGKPLFCWNWLTSTPSMNFSVVEDNFATEAEAQTRLQKLKGERK